MSNNWFIGDIHAGHAGIQKFRKHVLSEQHNRDLIEHDWCSVVTKRDTVYCMGDAAFTLEGLDWIKSLPGTKILVRGNHDELTTEQYLTAFKEVHGLFRYKRYWLSHAPIHPAELRGKMNIHGHVHYATIMVGDEYGNEIVDPRYINTSVENLVEVCGRSLISLDEIRKFHAPKSE